MVTWSDLRQTKVWKEAFEEGFQEGLQKGRLKAQQDMLPSMLAVGLSNEKIAFVLDLTVADVEQLVQQTQLDESGKSE